MNETLLRIRKVFEESGESQTCIGKKIHKTSQYVWKLLNDDNANPSESVIADICREFEIDEDWLRTGEGEMQIKRTRNQEIQALANSVMLDVDESFKKRFFVALSKLKESDWEVLEKLIDEISNKGGE